MAHRLNRFAAIIDPATVVAPEPASTPAKPTPAKPKPAPKPAKPRKR